MKAIGLLAACVALQAATASAAVVTVVHYESLQGLHIEDVAPSPHQKPGGIATAKLTFAAFNRDFDLRLEPNSRLLSTASRQSLTHTVAAYRGALAGKPGSWVRIVVADGVPRGLIWDGTEMFAVEAPGDSAVRAQSAIIYRLTDVYVPPGAMSCGASASSGNAAEMFGRLIGELDKAMAKAPGAISQINVGAIGDFEFFTDKGGASEAAILTRLNNVDGIYSEQLGVQMRVEELEIFGSEADPFTDTGDAGELLDELANYRLGSQRQRGQGLTHLYTGRNLDGNTVGIAFTDALCRPSFGVGLTQSGGDPTFDSLVAAHEIGHNFGAPHDGEAGSACQAETGAFLMSPNVNGSDRFSQCSIDQILPNIGSASCIAPIAAADMTVVIEGGPPRVALGESVMLRFVATNVGTDSATNAAMEIVLPNIVDLSPSQLTQVACSGDAGILSCPLGTMAGGSSLTANVNFIAIGTGTGSFVATVSADADDNPDNDEDTVQLTVDPAPSPTGGGGGGGATGLLSLVLLVVAGLSRRFVLPTRRITTATLLHWRA